MGTRIDDPTALVALIVDFGAARLDAVLTASKNVAYATRRLYGIINAWHLSPTRMPTRIAGWST